MKEVRIYFECLEQAAHFIKPILEQTEAFKKELFEIKLIKLTGNFTVYSKLVAPVVYLKDPDILITIIEDGIEYPLFQLEISTAVFTEDHELQRFDGIVASIENNCIYGKLSPLNKTSQSAHGGNTNFNYLTSYKAIYEKFGKLAFHFDWPCDKNGNVIVNPAYLSCPQEIKPFTVFLHNLVPFITAGKINFSKWIQNFENKILTEKTFSEWNEKLKRFSLPDLKIQNTSRTEWKEVEKEFHLKINRFGHAMDPERGMLAYYGTICDNTVSKMLFDEDNEAWYKDIPNEAEMKRYLKRNGLNTANDYLQCFILGAGLHNNQAFLKLSKKYEKSKADNLEIDLSQFLSENFLLLNKALRTILKFSKQFYILDTSKNIRLKFVWKKFNTSKDFQKFPEITPIQNRTSFDEDDITYISVHNVLKQNGYKIIEVSYPGAQGDRVVLAEAGTGRRQQRRYIDIISYLPKSHSALQENKGEFTPASIQSEIKELARYKSDKDYKQSIKKFVSRFDKNAPHIFKIGVGFWANNKFTIEHIQQLEIDKLDYFLFIKSDQISWKIFCTGQTKLFSKTEGKVELSIVYEILETRFYQFDLFEGISSIKKYPEYKSLNLPLIEKEISAWWKKGKIFEKSISSRECKEPFVFYEGPPSANGLPGIHHVMARTIKDLFCRYQTMKGKQVKRKAGWDTHGLPIEIAVEKSLGITKDDIGKKISVEDYNRACRKEVMKYKDKWEELTHMMGYWVDMEKPYITYENNYIESVWYLLKNLYEKNLLYKSYSIQPYSPAAGTGLSTHELNLPGCYKNVRDTSIVAQFKVIRNEKSEFLFKNGVDTELFFLAWTTTPWTLSANCALAVGKDIRYVKIKTLNPYSKQPITVILAKDLVVKYFSEPTGEQISDDEDNAKSLKEYWDKEVNDYIDGKSKNLPYQESDAHTGLAKQNFNASDEKIDYVKYLKGSELEGIKYEQLLPYVKPNGKAHEVIVGDFVTTEDGTGIVHTASVFGADDFRVCKQNGIVSILVKDGTGNDSPIVDKHGRFVKEMYDEVWGLGGEYVKEEYLTQEEKEQEYKIQKERLKNLIPNLKEYLSVDERIALKLKLENKAFRIEKYEHSYPHCWRTDKPILYYPLDSWFVKVTAIKDRMIELNNTINWKPEYTGSGRFGEWLNNLQDWNLSRSRFWGIPLPVWKTEDGKEELCIGSVEELRNRTALSVEMLQLKNTIAINLSQEITNRINKSYTLVHEKNFDLHRPFIDEIIFLSDEGMPMFREPDLIDVWFDSGAMPYAQFHFPFENKEKFSPLSSGRGDGGEVFPADFIAEGVDQTRGWFYTLHAIAALCFDSVAFKNVVSNGLVLDKNGNKMSKRLGNAVDPFTTIEKYGADAVRWYMVTHADPWDNLKFDMEGIVEKQKSFFVKLYNTYSFFALYANIDKFTFSEKEVHLRQRAELDQWILSELNSLIKTVDENYSCYEPTKAGRAIENFVDEHLSNWYVRLCRRRFWKGEYTQDKIAAYQTLYRCLEVVAQLSAPIAPFFSEKLFRDLNLITKRQPDESIHLTLFPVPAPAAINKELEEKMELAQKISSMILSIRKKENIRVRQPLQKVRVPILNETFSKRLEKVKDLILSEVNVKEMEFVAESDAQIVKNLKLNFKTLGKKCGKDMKAVQQFANENAQTIISSIKKTNKYDLTVNGATYILENEDVEIIPVDIPGWKVANQGALTVALDITITQLLREEGIAREIVNRIQNLRKERNFEVTDRIDVIIQAHQKINSAIKNNLDYICSEILAQRFEVVNEINGNAVEIEINEEIKTMVYIDRVTLTTKSLRHGKN